MSFSLQPTIAAIATPRGTGGVAIIRLSGPESWSVAQSLARTTRTWLPGQLVYDWIIDPRDQKLVDEVIFLPFKGPHSFTGEDCVEIQCHGGLYLSKTLLGLCLQQGAQPATAGEFTRRALLNGRIDLTQAESILDLIHAQGETLVKLSANNLHHRAVGKLLRQLLEDISEIQADLTASIDFPDEVDEPDRVPLANRLHTLAEHLGAQLDINRRNQVLRDGLEVAIIGIPNAGKSSVFNALLASERSIVTDIAGTTRDVIRETLSLKGLPVTLIDTAGLRETADRVEILGVERSWQAVETAQAIIYVVDGTQGFQPADQDLLEKISTEKGLILLNKMDEPGFRAAPPHLPTGWTVLQTSATTGKGLTDVLAWLEGVAESLPDPGEIDYLLSQRQLHHLTAIHTELQDAATTLASPALPLDLATVPLTQALLELQGLLGQDTTERVLDSVFERFCVGK
jgi:tRNA modification GTPase